MKRITFHWALKILLGIYILPTGLYALILKNSVPMDPPQNTYVGSWNGSTGSPIGKYAVLTAKHVGGPINMPDCTPDYPTGAVFRIDGKVYCIEARYDHPSADISVLIINKNFYPDGFEKFNRVTSPSFPKKINDYVMAAGYGYTAGNYATNGISWSAIRSLTWGDNLLNSVSPLYLTTTFNSNSLATIYEYSPATYDSGGPVYQYDGCNHPTISGVIVSISSSTGFSSYGDRAYAINVSTYYDWIKSKVDDLRSDSWVIGDINRDGIDNIDDYNILAANYGKPGDYSKGDLNGDQKIDIKDFSILTNNFGRSNCSN